MKTSSCMKGTAAKSRIMQRNMHLIHFIKLEIFKIVCIQSVFLLLLKNIWDFRWFYICPTDVRQYCSRPCPFFAKKGEDLYIILYLRERNDIFPPNLYVTGEGEGNIILNKEVGKSLRFFGNLYTPALFSFTVDMHRCGKY